MPMTGHCPLGTNLQYQYDRMLRWYTRLREIYKGKFHESSYLMDCDEMLVFFIFCYHLKDWIIKDTNIPKTEVENYINNTRCLSLCADIANGEKHLGIDKHRSPRSGDDLKIDIGFHITQKNNLFQINSCLFLSLEDGTQISALNLATECITKWNEFLNVKLTDR